MASARKAKIVDKAKEFLERNAIPNVTAELEKSLARKRVHQYNVNSKSKLQNLDAFTEQQAAIANTAALVYASRRKPIVELNWDFRNEKVSAPPTAATNVHNGSGFLDVSERSVTEEKAPDAEEKAANSDQNRAVDSEGTPQFRQKVQSFNEDSTDMLFVNDLQKLVSFVLDYDPPRLRSAHTQAMYTAALESGALRDMVTRPPCVARVRYPANLNAVIVIVLRSVSAYEADRFPSCFAALRERGHIHCDFASSFTTHSRCFDSAFLYYEPHNRADAFPDSNGDSSSSISPSCSPQSSSRPEATLTQSDVKAVKTQSETAPLTDYDREVLSRFDEHRARCRDAYDVRFVYRNVSHCTRSPYAHLDRVARTRLLCSLEDMREDSYPLPFGGRFDAFHYSLRPEVPAGTSRNDKWYTLPDDSSPIYAIDCEMVETSSNDSALVRVSVVDESLECIYDTLVRPDEQVVDYRTVYSGVSAAMLESVHVRLCDVQRDLASLLPPNALLCGHSLNFDLHALQIFHPYVIDTSRLFARDTTFYYGAVNGEWNSVAQGSTSHSKPSLRSLVARFLNETIQADSRGHSSIEDARATMRLVQLRIRGGLHPEQPASTPCDAPSASAPHFAPQHNGHQSTGAYCCPDCFGMQRGAHKASSHYALQSDFYEKLRSASQFHHGSSVRNGLSADAVPLFYRPIRAVSACLIDEPGCALDAFDARCTQLAQLDPSLRERTASWVVPDDSVASWSAVERLKQLGEYQRWVESSNYCANGMADGSMQHDPENQFAASTERSNLVYVHLHGFDAALRSGKTDEQTQQERLSELVFIHLLPILNAARCHQGNSLVLVALPGRTITEADVRAGIADQVARGRCYMSVS